MACAATIGLFYLQEALRLTGHSALDPETRALNDLASWLTTKFGVGQLVAPSMIQKFCPNHLRGPANLVRQRIRALVECGVLRPEEGKATIGQHTFREVYRIMGEAPGL